MAAMIASELSDSFVLDSRDATLSGCLSSFKNMMSQRKIGLAVLFALALGAGSYLLLREDLAENFERATSSRLSLPVRLEALEKLGEGPLAEKAWRACVFEALDVRERRAVFLAARDQKAKAAAPALDRYIGEKALAPADRLLACEVMARIGAPGDWEGLREASRSPHPSLRLSAGEAMVRCGQAERGFAILFQNARLQETRLRAYMRLKRLTGEDFPLDPKAGPGEAHVQVLAWKSWYASHRRGFVPIPYQTSSK